MAKSFKKNLLLQDVKMDACANFTMNGDILVVPCPWEDDKEVTNGERVRYKGGIEVEPDGRTRVKRYNVGKNGPMHDVLFETTHGCVKITRPLYRKNDDGYGHRAGCRLIGQEYVYVTFKFPKKYGAVLTRKCFEEEVDEIMSYLKTRKEETIWK